MGSFGSKQQQVACLIDNLADDDLSNIFKHLSPHERLLISSVCKRWHRISRLPWLDIIDLDLISIPGEHLGAIVKHCPKLQSIVAWRKTFSFKELIILPRIRLSSVKLYRRSSQFRLKQSALPSLFSDVLFGSLPNASWEELVLHDFDICVHLDGSGSREEFQLKAALPLALKRLQLSAIRSNGRRSLPYSLEPGPSEFSNGLGRLTNLTCLILASAPGRFSFRGDPQSDIFRQLKALRLLRELCIACPEYSVPYDVIACLPQLEVLFMANMSFDKPSDLTQLATQHPTLRILVIVGTFHGASRMPVRRLYPNGFGSAPLPFLNVFLGKYAFTQMRFDVPASDAMRIHPITTRLPKFLEQGEIAPIFDGVWIAAQIKESAKFAVHLWANFCETAKL